MGCRGCCNLLRCPSPRPAGKGGTPALQDPRPKTQDPQSQNPEKLGQPSQLEGTRPSPRLPGPDNPHTHWFTHNPLQYPLPSPLLRHGPPSPVLSHPHCTLPPWPQMERFCACADARCWLAGSRMSGRRVCVAVLVSFPRVRYVPPFTLAPRKGPRFWWVSSPG